MANRTMKHISEPLNRIEEQSKDFRAMSQDFAKRSMELYGRAVERMPENSVQYASVAAAGLMIGWIGYRLGKSRGSNVVEKTREASSSMPSDFTPVFKFLKLWMLYRAAV